MIPSLLPFGTIIAFAGDIDPQTYMCGEYSFGPDVRNNSGWVLCDGSAIMQSVFPDLFRVIGYTYGGSNGSFNLPDYRGYFLRGLAVNATQDPGYNNRTAPANGTADGVGSTQLCMVQTHEHDYTNYPGNNAAGGTGGTASQVTKTPAVTTGLYTDDSGKTALSGEETRPKNIYVNYIIYAGRYAL
ncbi:Microcystin-dependent protein [Chitinophaga sp. CF118]|uniref:tail fiber protein n=1 Tax=Chitinophaga sp. CF118 TaxID=1884367 RepID=UPI0008F288B7|nr:tail fiber protein [Chitinophaga sp. CF118]SFD26712.1 Microcystin-dependent protein [Chitinophaga sp. CF118]